MNTRNKAGIASADRPTDSGSSLREGLEQGCMHKEREASDAPDNEPTERRYREVVEDQTEVISRFRKDGTFTFVNEVYCRFFGKQPRELIGKKWQPAALVEDLPHIEAKLSTLSPSNPVVTIENRVYSGTGRVHWMQFVNRAFFDTEGRLTEIQSVGRDITEYKRVEEALRESDEFSHAIIDSVSSHIAVLDTGGVIVCVNKPWRRFAIENGTEVGQPARRTEIGVNYLEICRESHGESSEGAMAAHDGIRAVLDGILTDFSLEYPCHSPNEQRWFIMTVTPLGTAGRGVVISHTSITERKLAELALRDNEERYHSLFSTSMDAVLLTAPDGRILAANEAACLMFGRPEEELIQEGRGGVVDESDPRLTMALEERSKEGRFRGELTFLRKDGTLFPGEVSSTLFIDRHGQLRTNMVIRDITRRKRGEEALLASREEFQTLSRRLVNLQETNRRELARELHDRVGQNLTALSINLSVISTLLPSELHQAIGKHLDDSLKLVAETTDCIRNLMAELRPPVLDDLGLLAALQWYGREFASRAGLAVKVQCPVPFPRLAKETELSLFRIVQEP